MKRYIKLSLVFLILFIFNITLVSASTNTNTRTEDNYLINDWIEVTDSNRGNILNTPSVNADEKIYDFADLYTDSEETSLYNKVNSYIQSYNMDLVIVTINSNNKSSPQEYADDFYDYNNFGISSNRDGVLFLIDMQNREIYMSTTGTAIEMYNDYRINETLDSVYTYMSDEAYYEGTSNYINIIRDYASSGFPKNNNSSNSDGLPPIVTAMIISLVITIIVMVILINKNKLVRKATTAEEYLNKESVNIKRISDILISSNTTKHKIEHNSSSGGSSTHCSSSGGSHGGGGHRF